MLRFLVPMLCLLPVLPAAAQVQVDPGALDALQAPAAETVPRPSSHVQPHVTRAPTTRPAQKPAATRPALPSAPPAIAVIPPPTTVPTRPAALAAPASVVPNAPGGASLDKGGMRVTFGPGRSDLSPETAAALHRLAAGTGAGGQDVITVSAYAAGSPEDPSMPRRLSLSRGLAIRSVLMADGIPSPRIIVRAMGSDGVSPADRVDIVAAANGGAR